MRQTKSQHLLFCQVLAYFICYILCLFSFRRNTISEYLKITLSINVPIYWFIFLIANLIYVRNISRITCFESKKLFHNSSNINAKTILIIFNSGNGCWVNYDRIQRQYFNAQTASFTNNTTKYGIFLVGIHSSNC